MQAMQNINSAPETRHQEYLTFSIGNEEYAIDILKVQEIREHEAATRIAGAPDAFAGVINLRGVIVPVADLAALIGLSHTGAAGKVVIILCLAEEVVGMLVDQVNDVLAIDPASVQPVPGIVAINARHARGIAVESGRMLMLLDAESLINAESLPRSEAV